jgi:hypothetical protein
MRSARESTRAASALILSLKVVRNHFKFDDFHIKIKLLERAFDVSFKMKKGRWAPFFLFPNYSN